MENRSTGISPSSSPFIRPLSIASLPRAILHIDGDAFFASCEQAKNPALRGKPVVTGRERGIAASMSYEAKALGITRAMKLNEIKRAHPEVIIIPSDYETYALLSKQFFDIVRRYTSDVEEYGIDECFADITGLRRPHHMSYERIAERIQEDLQAKLGFSFSIGLASTKVLAKLGSDWEKPHGLTVIENRRIHTFLAKTSVGAIWGIGRQTTAFLEKYGIRTAYDFARRDQVWIWKHCSKPFQEIWWELNGKSVMSLATEGRSEHYSVQKMKTFTPPSSDPEFVFAQLAKNIESACIKTRLYGLEAKKAFILLRTQNFEHHGSPVTLSRPTNFAHELIAVIRPVFDALFIPGTLYRATMINLSELERPSDQPDLFGQSLAVEKFSRLYNGIDAMREKYGKHTLYLGASFRAHEFAQHAGERGDLPARKLNLLKGETVRRRVGIPLFGGELQD